MYYEIKKISGEKEMAISARIAVTEDTSCVSKESNTSIEKSECTYDGLYKTKRNLKW